MRFAKLAALALVASVSFAHGAFAASPENTLIIKLKDGDVQIALRPDLAPKHVERLKELAKEGAYDGVAFHRVIPDFMAQTGDVQYGKEGGNEAMAGMGGSDKPDLPAEFSKTEKFHRGTVGMARSQNPNSANSQFFIMFAPYPSLDGQYTIVGQVESGMEFIDNIKKGRASNNGSVANPDRMISVRTGDQQ
ncbi:peptidylprolyl isomerase [Limoniibacter endophyticus]|uniref:Peptidyl-prolyl cis-trans isomerase n=1 Tax=Limoniibacter endophyticus TaxID=1565040 RepID=A0A8J3GF88_9HYPH|nr:peptidylprolyl isomerase [Limoniibacter endophyticus]GHC61193.1 peptidyl-prolyl cis-trans isomerase [Limoniibacter endophyticus]